MKVDFRPIKLFKLTDFFSHLDREFFLYSYNCTQGGVIDFFYSKHRKHRKKFEAKGSTQCMPN